MEILTGEGQLSRGEKLAWAGATDIGLRRKDNQDSFLASLPFFLVADGMGGHAGGKQASETLLGALRPFEGRKLGVEKVHRLLDTACQEVMNLAEANLDYSISPPGTTLTGLVFLNATIDDSVDAAKTTVETTVETTVDVESAPPPPPQAPQPPVAETSPEEPSLLVVNVGDSRTYELADGLLRQITRDHSQVAQMLEAGLITSEMARIMPNRSVITRAVGAGQLELPEIDSWTLPVSGMPGSRRYLICSDGLHSLVDEGEIGRLLVAASRPEDAVKSLVEAALAAGGFDNVTVLVLDVVSASGSVTGSATDSASDSGSKEL